MLFGAKLPPKLLHGVTDELREMVRGRRVRSVLFICVRNSARSQMAEALLNAACPTQLHAESAGLEPGELNPLAIAAMREIGIDISQKPTKSVFDFFRTGRHFSYVVTVCDDASAERCPIFPGVTQRLHWSVPDPAAASGTWGQRLDTARAIRQQIKERVEALCAELCR